MARRKVPSLVLTDGYPTLTKTADGSLLPTLAIDDSTGQWYSGANPIGSQGGGGGGGGTPCMVYHTLAATGINSHIIKPSPATVFGWAVYNNAQYPLFVKLYDIDTIPNPALDFPYQLIGVQAGQPSELYSTGGFIYTAGLGMVIVKSIQEHDSTGVTADDCSVDIFYL